MARNAVLTREQIVDCAFRIVNDSGFEELTIRTIASGLGTSTAPIYTQYGNMDSVVEDLRKEVFLRLGRSIAEKRTADPFLDIGVGIIAFAMKNRRIFSYFFLSGDRLLQELNGMKNGFLLKMKKSSYLDILGDRRLEELLDDMWIYTYGLSALICSGGEPYRELSWYVKKLEDAGKRLISYHFYSSGKVEEYIELVLKHKEKDRCGSGEDK